MRTTIPSWLLLGSAIVSNRLLVASSARLAAVVAGSVGWRRLAIAVALGFSAAGALPPFFALPLLVPAFTGLVWLIDGSRSTRSAFAAGWCFGLGHFVLALYWIAEALLVDPAKFGWMVPFAVVGLSGYLALFPALAAAAAYRFGRPGPARVLVLGATWTAAEWLRGTLLTGFPWDLIGYVWTFSDAMLQLAAVTGIYGLSLVTVTTAAMPAILAEASSRRSWLALVGASAVLAAIWIGGSVRLWTADTGTVPGVLLRIVQPDIPQAEKWSADREAEQFDRLLRLSARPAKAPVTVVVWPETAVPFAPNTDVIGRARIASAAPPGGVVVTGAVRAALDPDGKSRFWNSIFAITSAGSIVATYDKFHLVPFGEYMPLRKYLPLDPIAAGPIDFAVGHGPRTLHLPGLPPVSPLVCYEAIFPGEVVNSREPPSWLLNLTNDAWFGQSAGPYQHFSMARTRAVEQGIPLVRAANTGISAVVDPYGRVVAQLGLGRRDILNASLPKSLSEPTFYARYGDWSLLMLLACTLGAAVLLNRYTLPRPVTRHAVQR